MDVHNDIDFVSPSLLSPTYPGWHRMVFVFFFGSTQAAWFMNYGSVKQVHFFKVASTDLAVMS